MSKIKHNGFQSPSLFVRDSVSADGETIQLIGADGRAHTLHVDDAVAIIEAAERYGDVRINTAEFEALSVPETPPAIRSLTIHDN